MRILFHCVNGLGLGHLSRQLSIACALRDFKPNTEISFITSAEEHSWLKDEEIPYYYIPSESHFRYTWQATENYIPENIKRISAPRGLNAAFCRTLLDYLKPSAIVFDTYFTRQLVDYAILIKAIPLAFFDNYHHLNIHKECASYVLEKGGYLIIGCEKRTEIPITNHRQVAVTGRILRRFGKKICCDKNNISKDITRLICIQGGGGFNSSNCRFYKTHMTFIEVVARAVQILLDESIVINCHYILGPYGRWPQNISQQNGMQISRFCLDILPLLFDSDLMVSTAGYNAVSDSILSNCPGVFLPIVHTTENQTAHLEDLVNSNLCITTEHDPVQVAEALRELTLNRKKLELMRRGLRNVADRNQGANLAARFILDACKREGGQI